MELLVKNLPEVWEIWVWSLGWEDPLEEDMTAIPLFLPGGFDGHRSLVGYSHGVTNSWTLLSTAQTYYYYY